MMKFEIGDVVWVRAEFCGYHGSRDRLVLEVGNGEVIAVKSDCKTSPEFDIEKAVREVLLSDEFMTAFAAAFQLEAVSQYTFSDEVRSLEHPIPGVNRPMRNDHPLAANLVGAWVPDVSAEAPKTANRPKILDSSNPSESPNSSSETPKPSKTQPPSGYRLLGPAKDEPRTEGDQYWSLAIKGWTVLTSHKVEYANQHDWPACRKIEPPSDKPTPWTPKVGERVVLKATGAIYRIESYNEDSKQYSMQGWPGSCVNLESIAPWFETEPPPKRYRDPTKDDLRDGAIECEYRDNDDEQWRSGLLVYILSGSMRFLCANKEEQLSGQWNQCRIEVR